MINITDKAKCCGCSACAAICPINCIEMEIDSEGFAYPRVNEAACVDCGACERVCPIDNRSEEVAFPQDGYVVQNKDEKVLKESTAGGAFTAIAKYVIHRNGVVFGAALSDKLLAHHIWVDTEKDLGKFRNSKYMQSTLGGGIKLLSLS